MDDRKPRDPLRGGVCLRFDPRENYIKRLLLLDRTTNRSFRDFYHRALLILHGSKEIKKVETLMAEFLHEFRSEKGIPGLESILYELDNMRIHGKKYLLVKTRYTRRKFTYPEVYFMLQQLEDEIMRLLREKMKNIRILNPDNQV